MNEQIETKERKINKLFEATEVITEGEFAGAKPEMTEKKDKVNKAMGERVERKE